MLPGERERERDKKKKKKIRRSTRVRPGGSEREKRSSEVMPYSRSPGIPG
jgi:hypothetical protein